MCLEYMYFKRLSLWCFFLDVIQKSKTSDLESSDKRSVSGHVSALSSGSALGEVEQRLATEHTTQVCCLPF